MFSALQKAIVQNSSKDALQLNKNIFVILHIFTGISVC